jgi:hypothetical protein
MICSNRKTRRLAGLCLRYNARMRPLPAPHVPGKTDFERFDNAVRQVLTISKEELLRREAEEKKPAERKRRHRKA